MNILDKLEAELKSELCITKNKYCRSQNPKGEWSYCKNCLRINEAIQNAREEIDKTIGHVLVDEIIAKGEQVNLIAKNELRKKIIGRGT